MRWFLSASLGIHLIFLHLPSYGSDLDFVASIQCRGLVTFKKGTMQGMGNITLRESKSGEWYLDLGSRLISGGKNRSPDAGKLKISDYRWWKSEGLKAEYDFAQRVLSFRYKYDSGPLGGGTQWTEATFTDCIHETCESVMER